MKFEKIKNYGKSKSEKFYVYSSFYNSYMKQFISGHTGLKYI